MSLSRIRVHLMSILIGLICTCPIVSIFAQQADSETAGLSGEAPTELFEKANRLYQQGKFKQAANLYLEIINRGYPSPVLWYNLGNSYVKSGKTGNAVVAYERAIRFAPRDRDLRDNLSLIQPSENKKQPFILLIPFVAILNYFTLNELFLIAEILYLSVCMIFILKLLRLSEKLTIIMRKLVKPVLVLFLISLCFFALKFHREMMLTHGVIIEDKTIARSGPGEEFTEIMLLPEGTKCRLLAGKSNGWVKIRSAGGRTGYIPSPAIEKI